MLSAFQDGQSGLYVAGLPLIIFRFLTLSHGASLRHPYMDAASARIFQDAKQRVLK
jgi:hypothetical protein